MMIGMLAFGWKSARIREVGKVFNRDDSTIRFTVHRLRRRLKESEVVGIGDTIPGVAGALLETTIEGIRGAPKSIRGTASSIIA